MAPRCRPHGGIAHHMVRRCSSSVDSKTGSASFTSVSSAPPSWQPARVGYRCWQRHGQGVWDLCEELGTGAFSIVRAARNRHTGAAAVVKILDKHLPENRPDVLRTEVNVLRFVSSGALAKAPHFARLLDVFEDDSYVYLILERCRGFQLAQLLEARGFLSEEYAAWVISQVATAVQLLHGAGVLHRDLKPDNIMFSDDSPGSHIRLIDFGMGALCGAETEAAASSAAWEDPQELLGSAEYMAPEVLRSQVYSPATDVWALGVLAYTLLCGREPFRTQAQILGADPAFRERVWGAVSLDAQHFVRCLLDKDPALRPNANTVLSHPWLCRAEVPTLQARLTFAQMAAAGTTCSKQRAASYSGGTAAPHWSCLGSEMADVLHPQHGEQVADLRRTFYKRLGKASDSGFASPPASLEQLRRLTRKHASLSGRHISTSDALTYGAMYA